MRLRVLIIEDSPNDAALAVLELEEAGHEVTHIRVQTAAALKTALKDESWQIIISDHSMPGFNSLEALAIVQKTGLDIPFIILSGTIADETAIEAMRQGARDYLTKGRIKRLPVVVEREIKETAARRSAAESLNESQQSLQIFLDYTYDWEYLLEPGGTMVYISPSCERITGYSAEEFYRNPKLMQELVHPADQRLFLDHRRDIRTLENACSVDFRILTKSGETRWIAHACQAVFDYNGKWLGRRVSNRDITARKRAFEDLIEAQDRLAGSEAQLTQVIDLMPQLISVRDWNEKQILSNKAFDDFFGPGSNDNVGAAQYNTEEDREIMIGGKTLAVLERVRDAAGTEHDMLDTRVPYRYIGEEGQQTYAVLEVATDLTIIKKAEEALRDSEKRYRTIVSNVNDALIIHDLKGKIVDVNENACNLLGYTREEMIGTKLKAIDSEDSARLIKDRVARIMADGSAMFESLEKRKDGTFVPVEVSAKLVSMDGVGLIQAFNRDITDRRTAEKEQAESYKRLKATLAGTVNVTLAISTMKDPYTAGHELRVTQLALAIARELEYDANSLANLEIAGKLHDVGKIVVPAEILNKPGRLSDVEFSMIKVHAQYGYEILKESELENEVLMIAWQHHERNDGSGYPKGLKKAGISQGAQIVAVADVVEAMSSHRPYRPALGIDVALEQIMKDRGKLLTPEIVDICVDLFTNKGFVFT